MILKNKLKMNVSIIKHTIVRYKQIFISENEDIIAVEEPLEIGIYYYSNGHLVFKNVSITMRTPGQDRELALGFLFTENIIQNIAQIKHVEFPKNNTIHIYLSKETLINIDKLDRNFYTTSSCGVCGKASIDAIKTIESRKVELDTIKISLKTIYELKNKITEKQTLFASTGGLHASVLFDLSGKMLYIKEDVGRHNALDKLLGTCFINDEILLTKNILLLSGRISFELIQKAAAAHIKIVCAFGAPSSLAISLAEEFNMTLIGFLKEKSMNVYTGNHRIIE